MVLLEVSLVTRYMKISDGWHIFAEYRNKRVCCVAIGGYLSYWENSYWSLIFVNLLHPSVNLTPFSSYGVGVRGSHYFTE